jgi:hypothetical protein
MFFLSADQILCVAPVSGTQALSQVIASTGILQQ